MRTVLLLGALLAFWVSPMYARDLVVGFVDVPRLIDQSPQSIAAGKRLETEFAPRQRSINEGREELTYLREKLKKEELVITDSQKEELELSIRSLERRLKREEQDFREELNIKKNNEFKKVRQLVLKAITRFADTGEYDLILSEGVVFAHNRIDITDKIIEIMKEIGESAELSE